MGGPEGSTHCLVDAAGLKAFLRRSLKCYLQTFPCRLENSRVLDWRVVRLHVYTYVNKHVEHVLEGCASLRAMRNIKKPEQKFCTPHRRFDGKPSDEPQAT
ncbi:hypothetical protein LshimejAT787_0904140 [Lyophyllum shimeji]|uniref:Uncharacterized protein n=1 Tax=Lyophyllum shimeji TaxID=47721 RepID=A0A9P3UN43_LYOSH|nr:hypothetical protein LshimejAT787_0904140 [Lyophyllum shimeji]